MRLFITYAHENLTEVQQLVEILSAGGHSVWFDYQLLPGQDWKRELGEAIADCETYVYALTKASVMSDWCQWEFATAVRLHKPVVPVLLEADVAIPDSLQKLQYADLSRGAAPVAVAKLMGALMLLQKVPLAKTHEFPADPKGIPSRAWENVKHWTDAIVTPSHQPQDEAEEILGKFPANLFRGLEGVGGRIILTNQRLLFEAHGLNVQTQPLAIPLADIREVTTSNTLGIVPNGMIVHCRSGEQYRFAVWGRKNIIAIIDRHRHAPGK